MHTGLGDEDLLVLSEPDAKESYPFGDMGLGDNSKFDTNYTSGMNTDGANFVAYCWAETPGVSSFGGYDGNSSSNYIQTGCKVDYVMIKRTNGGSDWVVFDSQRGTQGLYPNDTGQDDWSSFAPVFHPTDGFTLPADHATLNQTGGTYIYAAFAGPNPIEVLDVDVAANTMTVDGGKWIGQDGTSAGGDGRHEPSQEWSATPISTGNTSDYGPSYSSDKAFDNNPATFWYPYDSDNVNNRTGYINFGTIFAGASQVKITYNHIGASYLKVNNINQAIVSGTNTITVDVSGVGLETIQFDYPLENNYTAISLIEVDAKPLVDTSVPGGGGKTVVTGPPRIASAVDVNFLDGSTLGVSNVTGTWVPGLFAQGAEITQSAPDHSDIVFTSMNGGTTPYTGELSSMESRTWTLEKSSSATGPWVEVGVYVDYAAVPSQDGATPWVNPTLEADTFYQVKVRYDAVNAEYKESTFHTFKTAP